MKRITIALQFLIIVIIFFQSKESQAQNDSLTQTVRGKIYDDITKTALFNVSVVVVNTNPVLGAMSDEDGNFKIGKVPVGRQTLKFSVVGYEPTLLPDIIVGSGKEIVLEIAMTESINKLNEVEIVYDRSKDPTVTNNEMSTVSARSFNPDDTRKYAGALGDPSRMAANFAGVVAGNDSRNDIIVRGNTPNATLWQMEGLNIPNPNHYGGSYNTGGPVSMLNFNNLGKSDFFTGAFPSNYGNATGGVFDIRLREGNNEKHEFLGMIGFNGFEVGAEGPLSKRSKSSYIINYRYSTLGLLQDIGVDLGTGASTPQYQDVNFKLTSPIGKKGKFTAFGFGGFSSIDILGADVDTTATTYYGSINQDVRPRYQTGVMGISYDQTFGEKTWAKITLGASNQQENYEVDSLDLENGSKYRLAQGKFSDSKYSVVLNGTHKFNAKNALSFGANSDYIVFDYINQDFFNRGTIDSARVDQASNYTLSQGYVQLKHRFNERLSLIAGVHAMHASTNNQLVLEPRAGLKYRVGEKSSINMGYGLHHQLLPTYNLFVRNTQGIETNKELDFSRSHHIVTGFETMFNSSVKFKVEGYYQMLDKVPVTAFTSSFSAVNIGADNNPSDQADLVNGGTGTNYGLELTLERYFSKGYYFLMTGSVFESTYEGSDGIERNTAFNTNYAANVLAGKEFQLKKKGSVLYANLKLTTLGGRFFTPINKELSQAAGEAIFDNTQAFSERQDAYFRADIKIGYRRENKRSTFEVGVDFQNITGNENIFQQGYNVQNNTISEEYQQGFFPVPMIRFTF
jgi:hypothetical protein